MSNSASFVDLLLPFVFFFAIFYFLVIRPQQKSQKSHKEMLESLKRGDTIVTNGGLIVKVLKNEATFIKAELDAGIEVKIDKEFISKKKED
ncbi:MAG: Preprotein translocase subunit YajC (TC 3.A.5.1.1) [uncultured Campylobacterales bacterium]|uniref:Sec translocon accessory complex subunit YajC n=1 Tax=uncultured Campylobacterales bacterium TaxID=352960 RepID=A0A6S6TDY7_9BACT|nr:MAG: Preprotein translocase subunit YajC (TC 3.A.5.1.1) [uncultured Campylobacterales bacterium]